MRRKATVGAGVVVVALVLVVTLSGVSSAQLTATATLDGYHEVPSVSTTGDGTFSALISEKQQVIQYTLRYSGLEGNVTAAHIHFGQEDVVGGVIAFLCGGGGKPACPQSGEVTGRIRPSDIIGPSAQGIAPGEFEEAVAAMKAGFTYANVHSDKHPGGEIRGQISTSQ